MDLEELLFEDNDLQQAGVELATVSNVYSNGVTLLFDGEAFAHGKRFKVNPDLRLASGDRVYVKKISGSYLVVCAVGNPHTKYPIPSGGTDGQFLVKDGSAAYAVKWVTKNMLTIPSGGSSGQVLGYLSDSELQWVSVANPLPTGGTDGQYLAKNGSTNYSVKWVTPPTALELPTGGSNGQVLGYNNSTSVKWVNILPTTGTTGYYLQKTATGTVWASVTQYSGPTINGYSTSTLGFFGTTATSRKSVAKCSTSGTVANAITTINNLLTALAGYGLIISA